MWCIYGNKRLEGFLQEFKQTRLWETDGNLTVKSGSKTLRSQPGACGQNTCIVR